MSAVAAYAQLQPLHAQPWLKSFRESGRALWQHSRWPDRKTEDWRYTNLRAIEEGNYLEQVGSLDDVDPVALAQSFVIPNLQGLRVVFVNGHYHASLSDLGTVAESDSQVVLTPFSLASDQHISVIKEYLGSAIDFEKHSFAALNNQLLNEGMFVYLQKNALANKPIHVVNITTQRAQNFNVQPRLLVVAEENSQATIIEHFVSTDTPQNVFVNNITELHLQANAKLTHYRLNQEHDSALHIGAVHAKLHRASHLDSFYLAWGSELKRLDIVVDYFGEGASSALKGVYLPSKTQHVDFHTCIEHRVPRCSTDEVFRGIVGDSARAVFNGRIHIHPKAQKTLAKLSNKNLLTSAKAEVYTKPELEIYADDVQCGHGATVAQLDETAMHYLRTRGISAEEAKVMLSFGFINELINTIELAALADYLRPLLAYHFARDPNLVRHLG